MMSAIFQFSSLIVEFEIFLLISALYQIISFYQNSSGKTYIHIVPLIKKISWDISQVHTQTH